MKYKKTPLITNLILPSIICFVLNSCSQNKNFITKDEKKTPRKALSFLDEEFKGTTFSTDFETINSSRQNRILSKKFNNNNQKNREDLILFKKAKTSFQKKDFKNSIKTLQSLEKKFPDSNVLNDSRLQLALAYFKIGNKTKAHMKLEENIKKEQIPEQRAISLSFQGRIYESEKKLYKALSSYAKAFSVSGNVKEDKLLSSKIINLSKKIDPQHKLVFLTNTFREKNAGPYFRIALIKRSIQNNKLKTALASTRIFIEEYPKHKFFNQISSLEKKIRNILSKKLLKVGVLLPLSGKNGQEGEKVYRGIQIALSHLLEKRPDLQVEFSVRNIASSENPSMHIQKKTNELINNSNVVALIGPLFRSTANIISAISEKRKIPLVIPYAPNFKMDKNKNWIFRNTLNNEMQNRAIFNFAIKRLKLRRFALVHARNEYQFLLKKKYQNILSKLGGVFTKIVSFPINANDFRPQMLSLGGLSDFQLRTKFPRLSRKRKFKAPVNFEAILISAKAKKIILIVPELPFYNIKEIVLLGDRNWNNPDIAKHTGSYIKNAFFVDGFFDSSKEDLVRRFVTDYEKLYRKKPGLLEALGYDSAKLIFSAISNGNRDKQKIQKYLRNLEDFQGVTGRIKGIKNNDFVRELYLLKFRKGIIHKVDMIFP